MTVDNRLLEIRMLCFLDNEYSDFDDEQKMEIKCILAHFFRIGRRRGKKVPLSPLANRFLEYFWMNNQFLDGVHFKTLTRYEKKEYTWRKIT